MCFNIYYDFYTITEEFALRYQEWDMNIKDMLTW